VTVNADQTDFHAASPAPKATVPFGKSGAASGFVNKHSKQDTENAIETKNV